MSPPSSPAQYSWVVMTARVMSCFENDLESRTDPIKWKGTAYTPNVTHVALWHLSSGYRVIHLWLLVEHFAKTIRMTFGGCVCVCVCVCVHGISPSITGRILMKLRMDIPVHHAQCVWQTIEHRSKVKVKVTENTKTTILYIIAPIKIT